MKYKQYIIAGALVVIILVLCLVTDILSVEDRVYDDPNEPVLQVNGVPVGHLRSVPRIARDVYSLDLTREQQVELMKECIWDAKVATEFKLVGRKAMPADIMPITAVAVAFFEYRTRGCDK